MSTTAEDPHAIPTNSAQSDTFVLKDKLGNIITDESNPAYLAGALVDAKAALQRMPAVKRFLEERTLVVGHRTVIDHKEAVPFVTGLLALPERYGLRTSAGTLI